MVGDSHSLTNGCDEVLRLEPNNEAARRELEKMEEFLSQKFRGRDLEKEGG